jgi:hypothetical protein
MIEFLARFSPRLHAALRLPLEIDGVFRSVEALLRDRSGEADVMAILNELRDVRRRIHASREV